MKGIILATAMALAAVATLVIAQAPAPVPVAGSASRVLNHQGPLSAVAMDGTDKVFFTYTLPANTMGAGGCIFITFQAQHSTGTTTLTEKLFFGATSATLIPSTDVSVWTQAIPIQICNDSGSTNAQTWLTTPWTFGNTWNTANSRVTSAIDTTQAVVISLTANDATTSDRMTPFYFTVF